MPQRRNIQNPTSHVYPFPGSLAPWSACMRWVGAVLVTLLGLSVQLSWAANTEDRDSLRGLPGVRVLVEKIQPEVERAGLTRAQLQTDVELRLRQAGIRVLTYEERLTAMGKPLLYINVNIMLNREQGSTVYNIDAELHQSVTLDTGKVLVGGAVTWHEGTLGGFSGTDVSRIREFVRDYVDQFINAYLSVNPRPAGSPPPVSTPPPPAPQPVRRTR